MQGEDLFDIIEVEVMAASVSLHVRETLLKRISGV